MIHFIRFESDRFEIGADDECPQFVAWLKQVLEDGGGEAVPPPIAELESFLEVTWLGRAYLVGAFASLDPDPESDDDAMVACFSISIDWDRTFGDVLRLRRMGRDDPLLVSLEEQARTRAGARKLVVESERDIARNLKTAMRLVRRNARMLRRVLKG